MISDLNVLAENANVDSFSLNELKGGSSSLVHIKSCDTGGGCGAYRLRNKYKDGQFDICSPLKDENNLKRAILHTLSPININNTNGRVYNEIQL